MIPPAEFRHPDSNFDESLFDLGADDLDLPNGAIAGIGVDVANGVNNVHSALDAAEDGVLVVEPGGFVKGDEELRAVGVFAGIGHAEDTLAGVFEAAVELIPELAAPEGLAAATSTGGVTTLDHEVLDDAVEDDAVVVTLPREPGKVLASLGRLISVELDDDVALDFEEYHVS